MGVAEVEMMIRDVLMVLGFVLVVGGGAVWWIVRQYKKMHKKDDQ